MPDSALILFAQPTTAAKARKFGGAPKIHYPTYDRQMARIAPQFNTLQQALQQGNLHITDSVTGVDPEYTLVFETIGDPYNFYKAVQKLKEQYPNIEWILELSGQCPSTDDFYVVNNSDVRDDDKQLATKVFCIMTNQQKYYLFGIITIKIKTTNLKVGSLDLNIYLTNCIVFIVGESKRD